MNPVFSFATASEILFGRGQAQAAVPRLVGMGRTILLVHGRRSQRSEWLRAGLTDQGCEVLPLAVPAEPDLALIEAESIWRGAAGCRRLSRWVAGR